MTASPDLARPDPVAAPAPSLRTERRAPRALLVEDEPVVGELLAEFLELEGYEVDRAREGGQALELVRRHVYTLIVSDVRMPDVDGPAFYYQLRAVRPELARRMVFVTGDITNADTRRFLDETCLRYLEKPFTIAQFQTVVQGVLAEFPVPDGGAPSAPA